METKLFVATPCYGNQVFADYMMSIMELERACRERNIQFEIFLLGKDALITRARNVCVKTFLDKDFTHMLFVDADMSFSPANVFRLLDFNVEVCGGNCPTKGIEWANLIGQNCQTAQECEAKTLKMAYNPASNTDCQDGFVEATNVGTGFMMIQRKAFHLMMDAYPSLRFKPNFRLGNETPSDKNCYAFFDSMIDPDTKVYLSEDYAFCWRWSRLGGKIYLDTRSIIVHIGNYEYGKHQDFLSLEDND